MTTTEADQHTPTGTDTTPTACGTCAYADEHGCWGREGTHCRTCHRDFRGTSQMHCVTCHEHFTTSRACDMHRCTDPGTVRSRTGAPQLAKVDRWGGTAWARVFNGPPRTIPQSRSHPV